MPMSLLLAVALVPSLFVAEWLYQRYWLPRVLLSHIPTVSFEDGKGNVRTRYLREYKDLIREGYRRYTKNGLPFKVLSSFGQWRVVIPPSAVREIKTAAGDTLSWQKTMRDSLMIFYTGSPDRAPWSGPALRVNVTKRLDSLSQPMMQTINQYCEAHLTDSTTEWQHVDCIYDILRECIATVVSQTFCGPELANDPDWIAFTLSMNEHAWGAASEIRQYSGWERLFRSYVLPVQSIQRIGEDRRQAQRRLEPLFRERSAALRQSGEKSRYDDAFQWMLEAGGENMKLQEYSDTMLRVFMAAIHTTATLMTLALAQLLHRPSYMSEILAELETCLADRETAPRTSELEAMRKLDSFIKESARFAPIGIILAGRKVTTSTPHTFTSTEKVFSVPKGVSVYAAAEATLQDPDLYPSPEEFDGMRFFKLRCESQAADKRWMLGNSTLESLNFGYGAQACPGRWFAVQEMFLIFAKLLMDYEVESAPSKHGQTSTQGEDCGPRARYIDALLQPPTEFGMRVRRKEKPRFPCL